MKKRVLSIIVAFVCVIGCVSGLTACVKRTYWEPPRNVVQNLPDKIHVVYNANDYSHGLIFVKDGDEYYVNGKNKWYADRREIYMRTNLTKEVCKAEDGQGWLSITAHWTGSEWILAEDETEFTPANAVWHANDHNLSAYYETEYITRTGYIDVNTPILDHVTITQLDNQTVTLRSGQQVECVVWDYVYEHDDVYSHYVYWYAAETGVYIKERHTFDKDVNVETDGTAGEYFATYYKVGDSMDTAMEVVSEHMGETRTKYVFAEKYN